MQPARGSTELHPQYYVHGAQQHLLQATKADPHRRSDTLLLGIYTISKGAERARAQGRGGATFLPGPGPQNIKTEVWSHA